MCAIAGELNFKKNVSLKNTQTMLNAMIHRGPDGQGTFAHKRTAFGMNRLSIVDLKTGGQPIFNEKKDVVAIGNGEIYNYLELQKKLAEKGHIFTSKSDIETVVHLYEEYGTDFVNHLRGMFALAIYDSKQEKVILARDRFGEKPLYYKIFKDKFMFSSELRGILSAVTQSDIDQASVAKYFYYAFVPEPFSIIKGVNRLEPATSLEIDIRTKSIKKTKYWNFPNIKNPSDAILFTKIKNSLSEAVKISTRADVPVGISLSGGLDSAAIAAFSSQRKRSAPAISFCVGYKGNSKNDERALARKTAKKFNLKFIEDEIASNDFVKEFPDLVSHLDEPISDLASYPIYRVAKLAHSRGIKVLLTGLGGDELFWGYPSVREIMSAPSKNKDIYSYFPPFTRTSKFTRLLFTKAFNNKFNNYKKKRAKHVSGRRFLHRNRAQSTIENLCNGWLSANSLALADRLGMANSVEMRAPFLDYKLAETLTGNLLSLNAYKIGHKKYLVRSVTGLIPKSILSRPKKAFTPHVVFWLPRLIFQYMNLLNDGYLVKNKIISKNKTKALAISWVFFPRYWEAIYQLLVLEIWCRQTLWKQKINY